MFPFEVFYRLHICWWCSFVFQSGFELHTKINSLSVTELHLHGKRKSFPLIFILIFHSLWIIMNCRLKQTALDQLVAVRDWEKYLLWTLEGSTTSLFPSSTVVFLKFKSARATNTCWCFKCTVVKEKSLLRVWKVNGRMVWISDFTWHFLYYLHAFYLYLFIFNHPQNL